jgi:hypothetical protein
LALRLDNAGEKSICHTTLMEEFIHTETGRLYKALLQGDAIVWPERCRNCEREFSGHCTSEICHTVLKNPSEDLIKIVRDTLFSPKKEAGVNYCCINNLRPQIQKKENSFSERGVSGNSLVYVEEGLTDWYDLTWEQDDDRMEPLNETPEFSFFSI